MTSPAHTPPAFLPVIRVAGTRDGVDPGEYCARLVRAFVPDLASESVAARVASMQAGPVSVVDPDQVLRTVPAAVRVRLQALADRARTTAQAAFVAVPDALIRSVVTVVNGGRTFPVGTVVWLRYGTEADLQFIFPLLVANLATGDFEERRLDGPSLSTATGVPRMGTPMIRAANITVKSVAESAAEVASSVSWALPPPWNVGVTAGLSLLQILMHATDQPDGPSPMEQLKQSLETYLQTRRTDDFADDIRLFNEDLLLRTKGFTFDPDQLAIVGKGAEDAFYTWWIGPTGSDHLTTNISHAISDLERTPKLDDGKDSLNVACAGVTAWTTGQKVSMQLAACKLKAQLAANDASGFADRSLSWRTILDQIHDRLFDLAGLDPGNPAVHGWASRIEQWIDKARTARLMQLRVERANAPYTVALPDGSAHESDHWGWRFVDDAVTEPHPSDWKHFYPDTTEKIDACHSKTVEHKDDADKALNAAIAEVDDATKDATTALRALRSKVTDIANLQPPKPPADHLPKVTPMTTGPSTPVGLWKKGAKVSYQIAFVNSNGPSDPGKPTTAFEIGDFAGATLSDIPQDPNADAIQVIRTIAQDGAKPVVRIVGSVQKGTTTLQDNRFS